MFPNDLTCECWTSTRSNINYLPIIYLVIYLTCSHEGFLRHAVWCFVKWVSNNTHLIGFRFFLGISDTELISWCDAAMRGLLKTNSWSQQRWLLCKWVQALLRDFTFIFMSLPNGLLRQRRMYFLWCPLLYKRLRCGQINDKCIYTNNSLSICSTILINFFYNGFLNLVDFQ